MFDRLEQFLQKGEFPPPPEYYTPGTPLALYHFTAGNIPEEPGAALLVFEEDAGHLYGVMCDRENFSRADQDRPLQNSSRVFRQLRTVSVLNCTFRITAHSAIYRSMTVSAPAALKSTTATMRKNNSGTAKCVSRFPAWVSPVKISKAVHLR